MRVVDLGSRRGPAREAQSLYEEIAGRRLARAACLPAAPRRSSGALQTGRGDQAAEPAFGGRAPKIALPTRTWVAPNCTAIS